jgi:hypothetical protein
MVAIPATARIRGWISFTFDCNRTVFSLEKPWLYCRGRAVLAYLAYSCWSVLACPENYSLCKTVKWNVIWKRIKRTVIAAILDALEKGNAVNALDITLR